MPNKKQREKNRKTAKLLHEEVTEGSQCPNCKEYTYTGHFFPPSFGEEGFFICEGLTKGFLGWHTAQNVD